MMSLSGDWTQLKKELVHLNTGQSKLSNMNYKEEKSRIKDQIN